MIQQGHVLKYYMSLNHSKNLMLLVTSLVFIERAYHLIFAHNYSNAWSFMECSLSLMETSTTSYKKLSMQKKLKATFLFIFIQLWIEVHINIIPF